MREHRIDDPIAWWAIGGLALGAVVVSAMLVDWLHLEPPASWALCAVIGIAWAAAAARRRRGYLRVTDESVTQARLRTRTIPFSEVRHVGMGGGRAGGLIIRGSGRAKVFVHEDYLRTLGDGWGELLLERAEANAVPVDDAFRSRLMMSCIDSEG